MEAGKEPTPNPQKPEASGHFLWDYKVQINSIPAIPWGYQSFRMTYLASFSNKHYQVLNSIIIHIWNHWQRSQHSIISSEVTRFPPQNFPWKTISGKQSLKGILGWKVINAPVPAHQHHKAATFMPIMGYFLAFLHSQWIPASTISSHIGKQSRLSAETHPNTLAQGTACFPCAFG